MKAAVLFTEKDMRLVSDRARPANPGIGQVLVRMTRVGICGSDVEYWQHGRIGDFVLRAPMVIGHESAGVVVAVGPGVLGLSLGDRVALEPGVPCRACDQCRTGVYNLCPRMQFFATPPVDGSLCDLVLHPADFCFKLPDTVSDDGGAMCEPLSVGVHACERANVGAGSTVLVLGAGPIGLVCMLVARAIGARRVVMTDVRPERLAFALTVGASATVLVSRNEAENIAAVKAAVGGDNADALFDSAIECSGFESSMRTALAATRSGGTVCCVGLHDPVMNLPLMDANVREVDIRGIFRYRNTYRKCIALLETGNIDIKPLITHRFKFDSQENLIAGFEMARTGKDAIKVMFSLGD
jgi:L-iditol 2-dehydrogenase